MSNEPKETGRLEGAGARRQARIILLEKRNQQLEEALRKIGVYAEPRWIRETVDAALSSEAPEKEE